jgi:hypothetical protein
MPELQKAYGELCGKLGNLSFQIEMLTANLVQTKKELVDIVNETQSRQTLDAANPAPAATEGATA